MVLSLFFRVLLLSYTGKASSYFVSDDAFSYMESSHLISNLAWSQNLPFTVIGATQGLVDWDSLDVNRVFTDHRELCFALIKIEAEISLHGHFSPGIAPLLSAANFFWSEIALREWPVFALLARIANNIYDKKIPCLGGNFSTPGNFRSAVEACGERMWNSPEIFAALDESFLQEYVEISCGCDRKFIAEDVHKTEISLRKIEGKCCNCERRNPEISTDPHFRIAVPKRRDMAADKIRSGQPFVLEIARRVILEISDQKTPVFVEVGAHYGDAAIFAAALFESKEISDYKIFAFEPQPEAAELFRKSLSLNNFRGEISVSEVALVSEFFPDKVVRVGRYRGSSCHGAMENRGPFGTLMGEFDEYDEAAVSTLDTEISKIDHLAKIDLLMIHTNGGELEVLYGAQETFKRGLVRKVKIRFYAAAPFFFGSDVFVGEAKLRLLLETLDAFGCRNFQLFVDDPQAAKNSEEFPITADCGSISSS